MERQESRIRQKVLLLLHEKKLAGILFSPHSIYPKIKGLMIYKEKSNFFFRLVQAVNKRCVP